MTMSKPSGFAEVNGARLYYETTGTGEPVIFLHGNTLDARMWDDQFLVFAQQYQAIRYDLRGFGKSSPPNAAPFAHADDLNGLLMHLGLAAAHLVGLSRGGGIALDFAVEYPARVRSLTLVDTTLWGYKGTASWRPVAEKAREAGWSAAKDLWLADPLFAPAMEQPAVAARLKQMVDDYSGWHWIHRGQERLPDPPTSERLDQIQVPVLAVVGERDLPDFHAIANLLAGQIPNARKVVIAGAGHMVNMEAPKQFNERVLSFLR